MARFPEACAWCDAKTMDWNASFNGKDICNDCEEDAVEVEDYVPEEETK